MPLNLYELSAFTFLVTKFEKYFTIIKIVSRVHREKYSREAPIVNIINWRVVVCGMVRGAGCHPFPQNSMYLTFSFMSFLCKERGMCSCYSKQHQLLQRIRTGVCVGGLGCVSTGHG